METSFDQFWTLYDKKVSKPKAEKKWFSLSAKDQVAIMEFIPKYKTKQPDRQFRKDPCTFFNNRTWEDTLYDKDQEKITYSEPEAKKLSDYKPKEYDQSKAINHIREKLKSNYEHGTFIRDWGNVYTELLTQKCGMVVPQSVKDEIKTEVERLASIKPKNRFEPPNDINVNSERRDRELNWWLNNRRTSRVALYELI